MGNCDFVDVWQCTWDKVLFYVRARIEPEGFSSISDLFNPSGE